MNERCDITYEKHGEPQQGSWQENDTGPGWSFLVPADDPVIHMPVGTVLKNFVVAITHEHAPLFGQPQATTKRSAPVTVEFVRADEWDDGLFRVEFAKDPILCDECGEHTASAVGGICDFCEESNQPEDFTAGWKHSD